MAFVFDTIKDIWQNMQDDILSEAADEATVYYPITISGLDIYAVDNLFGESKDPTEPYNVDDNVKFQIADQTIGGKFRDDLYGSSVGSNEAIKFSNAGQFMPGDALFTCKIDDAKRNMTSQQFYTYFHGCNYVTISGIPDTFFVTHVGRRGLIDHYVCDVFLRKKNPSI